LLSDKVKMGVTYLMYCNYFCDRKGLCREDMGRG
jgi:hypothetical protein